MGVIIAASEIAPPGLSGSGGDDQGALLFGFGPDEVEEGSRGERINVVVEEKDVASRAQCSSLAGSLDAKSFGHEIIESSLFDLGAVLGSEFGGGGDFVTHADSRGFLWNETGDVWSAPEDLGLPDRLDVEEVVGLFFSETVFRDHWFVENDFDGGLRIDGAGAGTQSRGCLEAVQGEEEEKSFHGCQV